MQLFLSVAVLLLPLAAAGIGDVRQLPIPPLNDENVVFATKAINEYLKEKDANAAPRSAVKVLTATLQTTAMHLYTFEIQVTGNEVCKVTVFSRPWLNKPLDLDSYVHSCKLKDEEAPAPKAGLLGGQQAADWTDDNVQKALSVLVGRVNARSNSLYRTLPTTGEVTKQLVNGMIYRFKNVRMVETSCTKNDASTRETLSLDACPVNDDSSLTPQMCTGEVYWSFIDKTFNLNQFACKDEEDPAPKAGGQQAADWTDDNVQKALSVLVGRVNARSNSLYRTLPTSGDVTKQLVNGMIYRFKNVRMVETSCTKNDASTRETLSLDACPVKDDSSLTPQVCTGEVYWSFIDKTFNLNQFECKDQKAPAPKAGLLGGQRPAVWDDVFVQKALSVLVGRINSRSNGMFRVLPTKGEVTKQVVNGIIYRFKNLEMVETSCKKSDGTKMETISLSDCPVNNDSNLKPQSCEGEVYWNPRETTPFKINSINCVA